MLQPRAAARHVLFTAGAIFCFSVADGMHFDGYGRIRSFFFFSLFFQAWVVDADRDAVQDRVLETSKMINGLAEEEKAKEAQAAA